MFNYLYPILADKNYMTIDIHNDVPYVSFRELMSRNLLINRKDLDLILPYFENIISSTTIPEMEVESK